MLSRPPPQHAEISIFVTTQVLRSAMSDRRCKRAE